MAAVGVATQGAVGPREFWTMRLDLLIGTCLGRAALVRRSQPAAWGNAGQGYERRGDGTRVYSINSMDDLLKCPALKRS